MVLFSCCTHQIEVKVEIALGDPITVLNAIHHDASGGRNQQTGCCHRPFWNARLLELRSLTVDSIRCGSPLWYWKARTRTRNELLDAASLLGVLWGTGCGFSTHNTRIKNVSHAIQAWLQGS
eukprot:308484-Amphidinium_carterae.1